MTALAQAGATTMNLFELSYSDLQSTLSSGQDLTVAKAANAAARAKNKLKTKLEMVESFWITKGFLANGGKLSADEVERLRKQVKPQSSAGKPGVTIWILNAKDEPWQKLPGESIFVISSTRVGKKVVEFQLLACPDFIGHGLNWEMTLSDFVKPKKAAKTEAPVEAPSEPSQVPTPEDTVKTLSNAEEEGIPDTFFLEVETEAKAEPEAPVETETETVEIDGEAPSEEQPTIEETIVEAPLSKNERRRRNRAAKKAQAAA